MHAHSKSEDEESEDASDMPNIPAPRRSGRLVLTCFQSIHESEVIGGASKNSDVSLSSTTTDATSSPVFVAGTPKKLQKTTKPKTISKDNVGTAPLRAAKESTVGSPPPKKRKRKLSASERAASSSRAETVQKESGTRFVSKGKDIKNLQKAEARKRGIDEEELHTPGKVKKTHASSLYGELQHQHKLERAEARKQTKTQEIKKPIVFGGWGRGKGGRKKSLPKKNAG